jgi:hypothetical protein
MCTRVSAEHGKRLLIRESRRLALRERKQEATCMYVEKLLTEDLVYMATCDLVFKKIKIIFPSFKKS